MTHFGAFVDIGVGKDALMHSSNMKGKRDTISIGTRLSVCVKNVDLDRERINLEFVSF